MAKTKSGTTPHSQTKKYYSKGIHNWVRTTDLNDGELFEVEYKITDIAVEECNVSFLPINTILVAMYGGFGTIGKNSILKKASTINQSVCAILPSNKLNSEYFLYFLKFFRSSWKIFADGARKDPNINQDAVKNLFIYFPKIKEQSQIVNFLNTKTQAIDKKINLLTQKANYYKEYRKSIINETVCKGLDKDVKLKDSGIDWIGQIPEHWEVKRLKNIAKTIKGKNLDFFDEHFENSLPNLSLDYLRNDTVTFNNFCYSSDKSLLADEKDIIIIWDGAGVGEILKAKKGFISSTIAKFDFHKSLSSKYFFHLRDNIEYVLKQIPTGMGIPHLNPHILNNFPCPFPPLREQTEIAKYLDTKTQTIDKIVSNINTQIQTLKELRKTLINDAVTGKIKVN
ncbi:restriction endonuclease subunit S [Flavobacterium xanthum]|uniref:Type I restriction enzyme, S subunit n=1 Tax=Flavobacterium xanthum TaxID=69322 RepID=A0A1M7CS36_9FLAO|nr:type I restriction enzyme, S subunit [Flavobacterium xanthum]